MSSPSVPAVGSSHKFRCGDTARIEGTDYDIEVAYADYASGRASWFGWPEGDVEIAKLTLVSACSDEEHRKAVARWLDRSRPSNDHRFERVEMLYRPRAYWAKALSRAREVERAARAEDARLEALLFEAVAGPPDVEPLPPKSAEVPRV